MLCNWRILGSSTHQPSSTHGSSGSNNPSTERGELLWDKERERIKKREKEKEMAAKMAVSHMMVI